MDSWGRLDSDIRACTLCPRLRNHCEIVAREKKKSHIAEIYDGLPTPNFGDQDASLLIVGLAPAAHGANRTGRMFTGDRSGQWLYRALHRAGFANQSSYERADDGLKLINCAITAAAHCAPPQNKPLPTELENCRRYLMRTIDLLKPKVFLTLGAIGWTACTQVLTEHGLAPLKKVKFAHGAVAELPGDRWLIGSYHPSQQNTFTGRLTEPMFDQIFATAQALLKTPPRTNRNS
jgi:uracil-DNA glycosylase family 4